MAKRDRLHECLAFLREGDVPTVTKPDRLARSTAELLTIEADLLRRQIGLVILSMGGERLDTRNPISKLMLTILAGVATWERKLMLERQRKGIVGYPGDIGNGIRPTWQTEFSMNGLWYELDSHEAMSHSADVYPGQSGGPIFGWWKGDDWPSAVAVQSTQNRDENKASGGQGMVDLILKARTEHP